MVHLSVNVDAQRELVTQEEGSSPTQDFLGFFFVDLCFVFPVEGFHETCWRLGFCGIGKTPCRSGPRAVCMYSLGIGIYLFFSVCLVQTSLQQYVQH